MARSTIGPVHFADHCRPRPTSRAPSQLTAGITPQSPDIDWATLLLDAGVSDGRPALRREDIQVFFEVGDAVRFCATGRGTRTGTIEKLNPKRASVRCDDGVWRVPYVGLQHACALTATSRRSRAARLKDVATEARTLMNRHGLKDWTLRFNTAKTKLGECRQDQKLIRLSRTHAVNDPPDRVTDTILPEIAHGLAGPTARHGPAWKAIARRLGATPKSCAPERDETRRLREIARAKFRTGDSVSFIARGKLRAGVIVRLNPKRAKVKCGDVAWSVPYARLTPEA